MTLFSGKKAKAEKKAEVQAASAARAPEAVIGDERLFHVILAPHISEKGTRVADKHRQIVFEVRRDATKPLIRQAVEKLFNVRVETVTAANVKGKAKRSGKTAGRRSDWKKAYVRLKPGQDIDFLTSQKQ